MSFLLPVPERKYLNGIEHFIFNLNQPQETEMVISYVPSGASFEEYTAKEEILGLVISGELKLNIDDQDFDFSAFKQAYNLPYQTKSIFKNETNDLAITLSIKKKAEEFSYLVNDEDYSLLPDQILMKKTKLSFNFFIASWMEFILSDASRRKSSYPSSDSTLVEVEIEGTPVIQVETQKEKIKQGQIYYAPLSSYNHLIACNKKISVNFLN